MQDITENKKITHEACSNVSPSDALQTEYNAGQRDKKKKNAIATVVTRV